MVTHYQENIISHYDNPNRNSKGFHTTTLHGETKDDLPGNPFTQNG